jgi:hypothetical protein
MSHSSSQSAEFLCPMLYKAASILESRAGKKALFAKHCRFTNINADVIYANLQNLFMHSARQTRIEGKEYNATFLSNLAENFREMANSLNQSFDLKLKASEKKPRLNNDNITAACFDFADVILSEAWYENYPDSRCMMDMPNDFSYSLYALQSLGKLIFSHKTLLMGTGNKKLDALISRFRPEYISGTEYQYIHDLLVHDVVSIRKKPNAIIRFNACWISTQIVDHVRPEPSFIYFELKTGKVFGESKVAFKDETIQIVA